MAAGVADLLAWCLYESLDLLIQPSRLIIYLFEIADIILLDTRSCLSSSS